MESPQEVRIDKWLWAVRLYKTRSLATEACRGGHVSIAGVNVKPSRSIRVDEVISAKTEDLVRTVKVIGLIEHRVGAKLVSNFMEDQTPAAEYLRATRAREEAKSVPTRPRGAGRPTKKERRDLERFI